MQNNWKKFSISHVWGGKMKPGMKNHRMMRPADNQKCIRHANRSECPLQAK